jgi:hypothetical protein
MPKRTALERSPATGLCVGWIIALASNHGLSSKAVHRSRRTSSCIDIRLHIVYQYKSPIGSSTTGTQSGGSTARLRKAEQTLIWRSGHWSQAPARPCALCALDPTRPRPTVPHWLVAAVVEPPPQAFARRNQTIPAAHARAAGNSGSSHTHLHAYDCNHCSGAGAHGVAVLKVLERIPNCTR